MRRGPARGVGRLRLVAAAIIALAAVMTVVACEPTLEQATGIVTSVDSPALGRVDGFELLTPDGERLRFDTRELTFRPEFPAAHIGEHQRLSEPIEVTYRRDGDRLLVTSLDDA